MYVGTQYSLTHTNTPECERKNERKLGKQKYTQAVNESENSNEKESTLQGKTNQQINMYERV